MSMTNIKWIRDYVTAGEAIFTLENPVTGNRYTYKVKAKPDSKSAWFVSALVGPDNTNDYQYIGMLVKNGRFSAHLTKASRTSAFSPQFKGLAWLAAHINAEDGELKGPILFHHSGKCARCGRTLTTPESIERGLGPKCAAMMG